MEQLLLNTTNWFSVHWGNSSPQNCAALCKNTVDRLLYFSLWNALHQLCPLGQQPSLVLCSKNTCSSSLHSGMLCTSSVEQALPYFVEQQLSTELCSTVECSVEQALLYFEEQQLSSTLWCAAGPTTHSLDTETLDRGGPIFMVMCHFWHRGTGWGIRICCLRFLDKGFPTKSGDRDISI